MNAQLVMDNIVKVFPGVLANDHITLDVRQGEIHALLGENGAGKTTLMNILYGLYQPDSGSIFLDGEQVEIKSPIEAVRHGIGMIHQHFMLIPKYTVCENIALTEKPRLGYRLNLNDTRKRIIDISQSSGLKVEPDVKVRDLSVGDQQRVEIIKALYQGARILIMDEPTSVLTPQEADEMFAILKKLSSNGCTILFITHKLREVMEISHRITVLRDAKKIGTVETNAISKDELARMMVGREVFLTFEKTPQKPGQPVLEINHLYAKNDRHLPAVQDLSLEVRTGEIVGIAGVDGNGQMELADVVMGVRRITGGEVFLKGKPLTAMTTRQIIEKGVSHIPARRQTEGLVLSFSIEECLILKEWGLPPFTRNGLLDQKSIRSIAEKGIRDFNIKARGPDMKVGNMSGGNQQKVVLARELMRKPDLLVACHPTLGLDIGATEFVRQHLLKERERGAGVLLISTELDELISICDRLLVIFEGRIMGEMVAGEFDVNAIGKMMMGVQHAETSHS